MIPAMASSTTITIDVKTRKLRLPGLFVVIAYADRKTWSIGIGLFGRFAFQLSV